MAGGIAALLFLLEASPAVAVQSPEFCADRPGLTTGTCTVAPGAFQLETSFATWAHSPGESTLAVADSRVRYGLDGNTDLYVAFAPFVHLNDRDGSSSGASDLALGMKHRFGRRDAQVGFALLPFIKLPTAGKPIGNGKWEGGMQAMVDVDLSSRWSLALTPEVDWDADSEGGGHHVRYAMAGSIGLDLTKRWTLSFDGLVARARDDGYRVQEGAAAVSLTFMAAPTVQLDAEVDIGLARDTPDVTLTSGISLRL